MTNISKAERKALRTILTNSREYKATTMRIDRDGAVTALKVAGNDRMRYLVGYIDEMVTTDGKIRAGW